MDDLSISELHLHVLTLMIFSLPNQTCPLLLKYSFDMVNVTLRCFHEFMAFSFKMNIIMNIICVDWGIQYRGGGGYCKKKSFMYTKEVV